MIPLASDEAIVEFGRAIIFCLRVGDAVSWPSINPKHGQELLREIRYWREKAGLLPKEEKP